jgi:7-cyano-7-deazaguanine reductase
MNYLYNASDDTYLLKGDVKVSGKKLAAWLTGREWSEANLAEAAKHFAEKPPAQNLSIAQNRTAYQYEGADNTLLESFPNPMTGPGYGDVEITVPEFTSLCPLTGQPDFAVIKINYRPREKCVESKALKLYLGSFRMHGEFHEACVQRISRDLIRLLDPDRLSVIGEFTPRGGIPFWPTIKYYRPTHMLQFLKAPQASLEGLNTFRKGYKWAERVGGIEDGKYEFYGDGRVGLVFEGKLVGTADINNADFGDYEDMTKKHQQMNCNPEQLSASLERAYGGTALDGDYSVLYLNDIKMFEGES